MRAIIQSVANASVVTMDDVIISAIGAGLVVWVGMCRSDKQADIDFIVKQILNFKIYPTDKDTLWAKSVVDNDYEILCLSDVSLYYNTKGRFKPLFYNAMDSENAKVFFYSFVNELKQSYKPNKVRRGKYGTGSVINAQFVGPVFSLQSPRQKIISLRKGILPRIQTYGLKKQESYSSPKQPEPMYPHNAYANNWQPTRTIPRGVGKFYGQQNYAYPHNQQPQGHNQESYGQQIHDPQSYPQSPYGHQNPYGGQTVNHDLYGQQNVNHDPYGQQNVNHHPYGQQNVNHHPYGEQNVNHHPYGEQNVNHHPYGQQNINQDPYGKQTDNLYPYGQQNINQNSYGGQTYSQQHYAQQIPNQQIPNQQIYNQQYYQQTENINPADQQGTEQPMNQ